MEWVAGPHSTSGEGFLQGSPDFSCCLKSMNDGLLKRFDVVAFWNVLTGSEPITGCFVPLAGAHGNVGVGISGALPCMIFVGATLKASSELVHRF
jgi:hypothetical protein